MEVSFIVKCLWFSVFKSNGRSFLNLKTVLTLNGNKSEMEEMFMSLGTPL